MVHSHTRTHAHKHIRSHTHACTLTHTHTHEQTHKPTNIRCTHTRTLVHTHILRLFVSHRMIPSRCPGGVLDTCHFQDHELNFQQTMDIRMYHHLLFLRVWASFCWLLSRAVTFPARQRHFGHFARFSRDQTS